MQCGFDWRKECNDKCKYIYTCTRCKIPDQESKRTMAACQIVQSMKRMPKIIDGKCAGVKIKENADAFYCTKCPAFAGNTQEATVYGK